VSVIRASPHVAVINTIIFTNTNGTNAADVDAIAYPAAIATTIYPAIACLVLPDGLTLHGAKTHVCACFFLPHQSRRNVKNIVGEEPMWWAFLIEIRLTYLPNID
jgi:hypothetical protein